MNKTGIPHLPELKSPFAHLGLGLSLTLAPVAARAQTYQWTGGGANTNWSTATNWNPASAPASNADFLFSNNGGLLTNPAVISLDAARTVNSLTYDSTLAYTISGSSILTFGNTGAAGLPSITLNTGYGPQANHEINVPVTIAELLTITNNSTDNLTFNGNITNTGGIAVYGSGGTSLDSATYDGLGGIDKYGSGTLFMRKNAGSTSQANDIVVHEGILSAASQSAIDYNTSTTTGNPSVRILSGASLEIDRPGGGTVNSPDSPTPDNASVGGINVSGSGVHYALQGDVGAIYAAPLTGTVSLGGGKIRMQGDTSFGAFNGVEFHLGGVGESAAGSDFIKVGQGTIVLGGGNSWTGDTIIREGAVALNVSTGGGNIPGGMSTPASNPSPSRIVLDGGVFGVIGAGNTALTRSLGTGANQIYWAGDGGFAPIGSNMSVDLGGAGAMVTWGSGGFVPDGKKLIFGHEMTTGGEMDFLNPINLGSQIREIEAIAGVDPTINYGNGNLKGVISGTGRIHKTGDGVLALTAANTYSGETRISGGALSLQSYNTSTGFYGPGSISSSHIVLDGGVFMPPGAGTSSSATTNSGAVTYTPNLGTGAGQVSWGGNGGGFAAFSSQATTVRLNNNATTPLVWGSTASFLTSTDTLILSSPNSADSVTLDNAIDLNNASRTIRTDNGTGATDAILSQDISGTGTLNFTGEGTIAMRAANTTAAAISVAGADLVVDGASGSLASAASFSVSQGGSLSIGDNNEVANRLNDAATVTLNGAVFNLNSNEATPVLTETIAGLTLAGGANAINLDGSFTALSVTNGLTRTGNATVTFQPGSIGNSATSARIALGTPPAMANGIIPWGAVTVSSMEFATYNSTTNSIDAATGVTTAQGSWTSTVNYRNTGSQTLTADRTVGSLNLLNNLTIGGAFNLTVASGGILSNMDANDAPTISTATLTSGTSELIVNTHLTTASDSPLTISASIQDGGAGATTLVKTGGGTLILNGATANTSTGGAVVQEGILILDKTTGPALGGNITVGDRSGDEDVLQLDASNQFKAGTSLTLMGGNPTVAGSAIATLRFNGESTAGSNLPALENKLDTLIISMSGNLDFDGGLNDAPNYLYVNNINFSDTASKFTVSNWREFKDYLLIPNSEIADFASYADQIHFDGYEGTSTITRYNDGYWQITPLGTQVPEPRATTAAAFAAAALLTRRRRGSSRNGSMA